MYEYKTAVTDYEGMQEELRNAGAQGWRLCSVTPDTWRFLNSGTLGLSMPVEDEHVEKGSSRELSAIYYLLVFERSADPNRLATAEAAEETMNYTLPDL
jgi:hypothetical protein